MSTYRLSGPDGHTYDITAPDDATPEQVQQVAAAHLNAQSQGHHPLGPELLQMAAAHAATMSPQDSVYRGLKQEAPGEVARVGRGAEDVYRGVEVAGLHGAKLGSYLLPLGLQDQARTALGDKTGQVISQNQDENRLYRQGRGEDAGIDWLRLGGQAAAASPAMLIPGVGAGLVRAASAGAVQGGVQGGLVAQGEGKDYEGTALDAAKGASSGAVVSGGLFGLGRSVGAVRRALSGEAAAPGTPEGAAVDAGYRVPPSQVAPHSVASLLEGFAGKIKTGQQASILNQERTNALVREGLGMAENSPITKDALEQIRATAGKAYSAVKKWQGELWTTPEYRAALHDIGGGTAAARAEFPDIVGNQEVDKLVASLDRPNMSPGAAVELMKELRFQAGKHIGSSDDPGKFALGLAQRKAAEAVEGLVESNLSDAGDGALVDSLRSARQLIAKTHDVESALNDATGHVSARKLGALLDRGRPLSDQLLDVARFAKAFPKAAQNVEGIGGVAPFSPLDWFAAGSLGLHSPHLAATGLLRPAARGLILSQPGQRLIIASGAPATGDAGLIEAGRGLALPAATLPTRNDQ